MKNITINFNGTQVTGNWNEKTYSSKTKGYMRIYLDGKQYDIKKEDNLHIFEGAQVKKNEIETKRQRINETRKIYEMLYTSEYGLDVFETFNKELAVFYWEMDTEHLDEATTFFESIGSKREKCEGNYYFTLNINTWEKLDNAFNKNYIEKTVPYWKYKKMTGRATASGEYDPETKTIKVKILMRDCIYIDPEFFDDNDIEEIAKIANILKESDDRTKVLELLEKGTIDNKQEYDLFKRVSEDLVVDDLGYTIIQDIRICFENGFAEIYLMDEGEPVEQDIRFYNDIYGQVDTFKEAKEFVEVGF